MDDSFVYKLWLSKQFSWIDDVSFYFVRFVCNDFVIVISKPPEHLFTLTDKSFYYNGFLWDLYIRGNLNFYHVGRCYDRDCDKLLIYDYHPCCEYHYKNKNRYVIPHILIFGKHNWKIVGKQIEKVYNLTYYTDDTKIIIYPF